MYKKENIERGRLTLVKNLCVIGLIADACHHILNRPEDAKDLTLSEFSQIILNTIASSSDYLKEKNHFAFKMSELAVNQIFEQGHMDEKCPIHLVKGEE